MKKTICLNMIVKDEAHVIRRCLASILPFIDYWVIVDTGSSDGTQEVIRDYLRSIPGELYERPWVNFAKNRNEALTLARGKADYLLFIDADDRLVFSDQFAMPNLSKDYYYIQQQMKIHGAYTSNLVVLLIKDLPDFQWVGAVHEAISCSECRTSCILEGVINDYIHDGARSSDPKRLEKDILMLQEELRENPHDTRSAFYLAQTYRGGNDYPAALEAYKKRAAMGGRESEIFVSLYCIGLLERSLNLPPETFLRSFAKSYSYRPSRIEPLFQIGSHFINCENYWMGYLISKLACALPLPQDDFYIDSWMYDWGAALQFFVCSKRLGKETDAGKTAQKLLANPHLPDDARLLVLEHSK